MLNLKNTLLANETVNLYDFSFEDIDGNQVNLEKFAGKPILIVNTASRCGFTPQYEGMQALYESKKDDGLVVIGFPCNQFGAQESGTHEEIQTFCESTYGVTFPMMAKIDVNGENPQHVGSWDPESDEATFN